MSGNEPKISKEDMSALAKHIEDYLEVFLEVFIIPENMRNQEDKIYDSINVVKKLIKKLRKGDKSVFEDVDDIEFIDE
jgi:hypothetical protein